MKRLIIILLFLSTKYSTTAQEWLPVCGSKGGETYFMYSESQPKKQYDNVVKVWVKVKMPQYKHTSKGKVKIYKNAEKKILLSFSCDDNTMGYLQSTLYSEKGDVLVNDSFPEVPNVVAPESVGESLLKKACELFNGN